MSIDIKLFNMHGVPFKVLTQNKRLFYLVSKKQNPQQKFTLIVQQIHNENQLQNCNNEAYLQALGSHKNVIQSFGTCYLDSQDEFGFRNQKFCFLSEQIKSTLQDMIVDHIKNKTSFEYGQILNILKNIVLALQNLELKNIAFVNLHPENIFFDINDNIKLGCFDQAVNTIGLSDFSQKQIEISRNPLLSSYMDPQLMNNQIDQFDWIKGDIYCLGLVIIDISILKLKREQTYDSRDLNQVSEKYGKELASLLNCMLQQDTKNRIRYEEILNFFPDLQQIKSNLQQIDTPNDKYNYLIDSMNDRSQLSKNYFKSNNIIQKINQQKQNNNCCQLNENLNITQAGSVISQIIQGNVLNDDQQKIQEIDNEDSMFQNNQMTLLKSDEQDGKFFSLNPSTFKKQLIQQNNEQDQCDILSSLLDKQIHVVNLQENVLQFDEYQCDNSFEIINDMEQQDESEEEMVIDHRNDPQLCNMLKSSQQIIQDLSQNDIITFQYLEKNISEFPLFRVKLHQIKITPTKERDALNQCTNSQGKQNFCIKVFKNLDNNLVYELLYQNVLVNINSRSSNILTISEYILLEKDVKTSDLHVILSKKPFNLVQYLKINKIQLLSRISIAIQIAQCLVDLKVQLNLIDNLSGLEYLAHGNLKTTNILMDLRGKAYLSDFGTGHLIKKNKSNYVYISPEVVEQDEISLEGDIWSLGVIFYWLFFNKILTEQESSNFGLYDKQKKGSIFVDKNIVKEDFIKNELKTLISNCTLYEPKNRIKLADILIKLKTIEDFAKNPQKIEQDKKKFIFQNIPSKTNFTPRGKTPTKKNKIITK